MRQLLLHLDSGAIELADIPAPKPRPGTVRIRNVRSLISTGTERMMLNFAHAGFLDKARQQPEKVRQVLEKVRTDGLWPTVDAVRAKLSEPMPLGYSSAGVVLDVGEGVTEFSPGDRVLSNGHHAEVVVVPKNLCAKIPDGLGFDRACFGVVASIALHGVRLLQPTLGERFAIIGMGLLGQLSALILRAHGAEVLAFDTQGDKLALAEKLGTSGFQIREGSDPVDEAMRWSQGMGVDGVLIAASTKSDEPIRQAAQMSRKRGRIVLLGVIGLSLNRADFYEKELSFQVSCSYGPGRYDATYEEQGLDYPPGFVRWTEQRNFEAVAKLMADGKLPVEALGAESFDFSEASQAYTLVGDDPKTSAVILRYPEEPSDALLSTSVKLNGQKDGASASGSRGSSKDSLRIGVIGAGGFAQKVVLPALKKQACEIAGIASLGGIRAHHAARNFEAESLHNEAEALFQDESIDTLFVLTRHASHAKLVERALAAGKNVFVEKPLCLTLEELECIEKARASAADGGATPRIMVGFNRRFSPLIQALRDELRSRSAPPSMIMTVNAGALPPDH